MEPPDRPVVPETASSAPRGPGRLDGDQLAALANTLTGLHRRYFGRGATRARTYQVNEDLVIVELRDVFLTVERTLIARGQMDSVRQTRLTFQQTMFSEFLTAVETITGRRVSSYVTESITSPEAVLEIFYLEPHDAVAERLEREAREDRGEVQRPAGGLAEQLP